MVRVAKRRIIGVYVICSIIRFFIRIDNGCSIIEVYVICSIIRFFMRLGNVQSSLM